MVDDGESMSDIYDKLVAGPLIRCIEDKAWFRDEERIMKDLFDSLSRKLLRCLLLNNLGPDLYDRSMVSRKNWEHNVYDIDGPGAYVMFSYVLDREGRWLCKKEVEDLIDMLQDYCYAIDIYERQRQSDAYGVSQLSRVQQGILKKAIKIDRAAKPASPP